MANDRVWHHKNMEQMRFVHDNFNLAKESFMDCWRSWTGHDKYWIWCILYKYVLWWIYILLTHSYE